MKKYELFAITNGDEWFENSFDSLEEAVQEGKWSHEHLSRYDKKNTEYEVRYNYTETGYDCVENIKKR